MLGTSIERVRRWRATSSRLMLLRALPSTGRGLMAVVAGLVALSPLLSLVLTIGGGVLVGSVPGAVRDGWDSSPGRRLLAALIAVSLAFALEYVSSGLREALAEIAGRRFDRILKARVLEATLGPPGVAHVEDPEVLDKIAIVRGDATGITPGIAVRGIVNVAVQRLGIIPPFALLLVFRWWLPFLLSAALFWLRVVVHKHVMGQVQVRIHHTPDIRRAEYFVDMALRPEASKETRIFGLADWVGSRYRSHYLEAMLAVWKSRVASRRRMALPLAVNAVVNAIGYVVVIRAALDGSISLTRTTILITALGGIWSILNLNDADVQLSQGAAVLPPLVEVERMLDERRESMAGSLDAAGMPRESVRFESVCFHYPGSDHEVYAGLDLEIRAGESLAIVGVNGAGKTTLVKLLARLHDPTAGRITVDGVDLRDLDPDKWQRRVAAIFQDFTRYELQARDNVAFGALELCNDDAALDAAVEQAGAADVIERLPHGWDTVLSRRFTDGTDLSGGQWQRIALARALLAVRGGAGILVLDEPTANLDVRAEAEIYDRFLELTRGVTTVVISHRFSTVRRADRIVVLDAGQVVEDGSHDELIAKGGHYARMFSLQAARFAEEASHG